MIIQKSPPQQPSGSPHWRQALLALSRALPAAHLGPHLDAITLTGLLTLLLLAQLSCRHQPGEFTASSALADQAGIDRSALIGRATWYGERHHGRTTASGEPFDMHAFTAAHRTLPFGTIVRVIRQDTRQSVVVRINDRGPFGEGRIIDLSRAAAEEIELIRPGHLPVYLEIVQLSER